ncbi:hypothetical protein [Amycolatopsis sp. NPDC059657]|uniref:hypothetical protein n=1 Tax=Amycolatopsis sp. NPDC059657 TaxID=3346899 RepID=UPI0036709CA0
MRTAPHGAEFDSTGQFVIGTSLDPGNAATQVLDLAQPENPVVKYSISLKESEHRSFRVTLLPQRHAMVTFDGGGELATWDLRVTPPKMLAKVHAHPGASASVAVNSEEKLAASSGVDGALIIWDIADLANIKKLHEFPGMANNGPSIRFSDDGKSIAGISVATASPDVWWWRWELTREGARAAICRQGAGTMTPKD